MTTMTSHASTSITRWTTVILSIEVIFVIFLRLLPYIGGLAPGVDVPLYLSITRDILHGEDVPENQAPSSFFLLVFTVRILGVDPRVAFMVISCLSAGIAVLLVYYYILHLYGDIRVALAASFAISVSISWMRIGIDLFKSSIALVAVLMALFAFARFSRNLKMTDGVVFLLSTLVVGLVHAFTAIAFICILVLQLILVVVDSGRMFSRETILLTVAILLLLLFPVLQFFRVYFAYMNEINHAFPTISPAPIVLVGVCFLVGISTFKKRRNRFTVLFLSFFSASLFFWFYIVPHIQSVRRGSLEFYPRPIEAYPIYLINPVMFPVLIIGLVLVLSKMRERVHPADFSISGAFILLILSQNHNFGLSLDPFRFLIMIDVFIMPIAGLGLVKLIQLLRRHGIGFALLTMSYCVVLLLFLWSIGLVPIGTVAQDLITGAGEITTQSEALITVWNIYYGFLIIFFNCLLLILYSDDRFQKRFIPLNRTLLILFLLLSVIPALGYEYYVLNSVNMEEEEVIILEDLSHQFPGHNSSLIIMDKYKSPWIQYYYDFPVFVIEKSQIVPSYAPFTFVYLYEDQQANLPKLEKGKIMSASSSNILLIEF